MRRCRADAQAIAKGSDALRQFAAQEKWELFASRRVTACEGRLKNEGHWTLSRKSDAENLHIGPERRLQSHKRRPARRGNSR